MGKLWYLSPSNQKDNLGLGDYGRETDQMYRLTDAVIPHLERYGVQFHVAEQSMTLAQRSREANEMGAGWYLALHSNAGGGGKAWGPIAFYASAGKAMAECLTRHLLETGQQSNRSSNVQQTFSLYELVHPQAPACLLEVDFHDSQIGVDFLTRRRADAAEAIAKAIVALDGKVWSDTAELAGELPQEASGWSAEAIQWATERGLFLGDDLGNFNWKDALTREQAALLLLRFARMEGKA